MDIFQVEIGNDGTVDFELEGQLLRLGNLLAD